MYYDNKASFYVRQYGPRVLMSAFIVLIVSVGLYIYIANHNIPTIKVTDQAVVEQDTLNVTAKNLSDTLNGLEPLEKKSVKVASVESNGEIVIIDNDSRFKARLIGLDFENIEPDTIYLMGQDIGNRQVEIAFDNTKCSEDIANVYVYVNDELYNAKLLEEGKLKLDSQDMNKLLLKELTESQAYAKQTRAGLWEY